MKRLLCFFDGTWNRRDAKGEQTNVAKLCDVVPETDGKGIRQLAHYEIGIATSKSLGRLTFAVGAIGYEVGDRIQNGCRFLAENYEPGDEIYIFGFSRGAFQASALAELIALFGLPRADALDTIPALWDLYQAHGETPKSAHVEAFRAAGRYPVSIRCLGVWDTVGNLGVPLVRLGKFNRALALHSTQIPAAVDVALHALSIDEPRGPFSPTLWTKPKGASLRWGQIVEQVWFPGCHANVGGGYPNTKLSDISLHWMAERVMGATGVAFDLERLRAATNPNPLGLEVSPTSDTLFRFSRLLPFVRLINDDVRGISILRWALLGRWRSSRLPPGHESVNEHVHQSAIRRFGRRVRVQRGRRTVERPYLPRTLEMAIQDGEIGLQNDRVVT